MARSKRPRRCNEKGAKDGANGDTAVVPDGKMVDDEAANNDDLAAAVRIKARRTRVSTVDAGEVGGTDVEEMSYDDERELDVAHDDESNPRVDLGVTARPDHVEGQHARQSEEGSRGQETAFCARV